jgi:phosphoribosylformimino-5-aminoimidazole carboxamide ribotide isomerase
MLIIPVIDLSCGMVVHAKQGQRASYQPITSVISTSAEPETILSSFLELYPFKTIYIADLDAIQKTGKQNMLILKLAARYKQCEFWVDAGIEPIRNRLTDYSSSNIRLVFGSENKLSRNRLMALIKDNPELILSLDFIENKLTENNYLLQDTTIWTKQLIVMMLSRVGSNKGMDIHCLNNILKLAENNEIYAAGGARNRDDLIQLNSRGVKGVLLATALHTGAITKEDLEQFLGK